MYHTHARSSPAHGPYPANISSFHSLLLREELNHTTLQTPILCIDVYKNRNKVDSSSIMVSEFITYK